MGLSCSPASWSIWSSKLREPRTSLPGDHRAVPRSPDKIDVISNLMDKADAFLDRRRHGLHLPQGAGLRGIGNSLVEDDKLDLALFDPEHWPRRKGVRFVLPRRLPATPQEFKPTTSRRPVRERRTLARAASIEDGWEGIDIGSVIHRRSSSEEDRLREDDRLERPDGCLRDSRPSHKGTEAVARAVATASDAVSTIVVAATP